MAKKVKQYWNEVPQVKEAYEKLKQQYPNLSYDEYVNILNSNTSWVGVNSKNIEKQLEELKKSKNQELLEINKQELTDPTKIVENYKQTEEQVEPLIEADKEKRAADREKYKVEAKEDVTTELPGLTDNQRRQLQQSANAQINKQVQKYKRSMASQMGRRGVRGGAAFAPQAEIARSGLEAQNQYQRDLTEYDVDLAMRRLAGYLAGIEGRSAQDLIRRGQFFDYLTGRQQQGQQAAYNKYFENMFSGMRK